MIGFTLGTAYGIISWVYENEENVFFNYHEYLDSDGDKDGNDES